MEPRQTIFVIIGSAGTASANEIIVHHLQEEAKAFFNFIILDDLKILPHFEPHLSIHHPPGEVVHFRNQIEAADAVLICSPEYIFSIPAGLKNALEWCVATTVFTDKPVGIITASASGIKGHEELQLIMQTLGAAISDRTSLLIQGVKGKVNAEGQVAERKTITDLEEFIRAFRSIVAHRVPK